MTKTITYSGEIKITIPDNKIDEVLEDFRGSIDSTAEKENLFVHAAHNIVYCGCYSFIEGIGTDFEIEEYEKPDIELK